MDWHRTLLDLFNVETREECGSHKTHGEEWRTRGRTSLGGSQVCMNLFGPVESKSSLLRR